MIKYSNKQIKQRGFTLIELLIASAIFVIIMVLTTAIFSMTASYNGKLREMRTVSLAGRSVMEQLSNDIRGANGSANTLYLDLSGNVQVMNQGSPPVPVGKIGEITIFVCHDNLTNLCWYPIDTQKQNIRNATAANLDDWLTVAEQNGDSDGLNNSLLILQKNKMKAIFYRTAMDQPSVPKWVMRRYEREYTTWPTQIDLVDIMTNGIKTYDSTINPQYEIYMNFQGYAPDKTTDRKMQPWVEAVLRVETLDYDYVQSNIRAKFDLKTSIESRDYN